MVEIKTEGNTHGRTDGRNAEGPKRRTRKKMKSAAAARAVGDLAPSLRARPMRPAINKRHNRDGDDDDDEDLPMQMQGSLRSCCCYFCCCCRRELRRLRAERTSLPIPLWPSPLFANGVDALPVPSYPYLFLPPSPENLSFRPTLFLLVLSFPSTPQFQRPSSRASRSFAFVTDSRPQLLPISQFHFPPLFLFFSPVSRASPPLPTDASIPHFCFICAAFPHLPLYVYPSFPLAATTRYVL